MTLLQVAEAFYIQGVGPASYAEITWTVMAAFVAVVFSLLLLERRRDLRALHRDPTFTHWGPRHLAARMYIVLTVVVLGMAVCFVAIGVLAMSTTPIARHLTPYGFALNTFFMAFDGVMAWVAWFCYADYQRLRAYYHTQRRGVRGKQR